MVELRLALLGQCELRHRLESRVHVVSVLCGRLIVRDIVLRFTPHLGPVPRHLVVQVALVAQHDERKVVGVARAGLYEELVMPRVEVLERVRVGDVKHKDAAIGASVEGDAQGLKALLTGSVPDLHCDYAVIDDDLFRDKVSADCGFVLVGEALGHVLVHQGRLSNAAIAQNNHLQQALAARHLEVFSVLRR